VRPGQALAVTEVNAEVTRPRERPSSCGAASGLRLHTEGQLAPGDSEMAAGVIKRVAAAITGRGLERRITGHVRRPSRLISP
jgi:hypothetical protein